MPEFLTRTWDQVRAQLEGLTPSAKWLIGTLLVLGVLLVSILVNFAASPEMVTVSQFSGSRSEEVLTRLRAAGVDAVTDGGLVRVPKDQEEDAIVALVQDNLLSEDVSAAFDAMVGNPSPWATNEQNQRMYLLAKQKVLGSILRRMGHVKSANVVIDIPQNRGFGRTYVKPSASVTIATDGRANVQQLVEAAAGLVRGAVAEMDPANVRVIIDGRMHRVDEESGVLPTQTLEMVHGLEKYHEDKIGELLSYIPGVRVAVLVRVDSVAQRQEEAFEYSQSEPLRSEESEEIVRRDIRRGGEPGVRPNAGLDIGSGGGVGMEESISSESITYGEKPLVLRSQTVHTGHEVRRINVTVNVPRSYFVQIYKAENPVAEGEPDAAVLQPVIEAELAKIERQVAPLIQTDVGGQVVAAMIPDTSFLEGDGVPPQPAGIGAILVDSGWSKPAGVGLLAALAVGLMLWVVRKGTQQEQLPTVEELAGVPPRLPTDEELIGEALEQDGAMAGVELDEEELKSRKIAEQISDLIKNNPGEAGSILGRWVRREE